MNVFLNSLLFFLAFGCNVTLAAPESPLQAPHDIAPGASVPGNSGMNTEPEAGYTEEPAPVIAVEPIGKPSIDGFGTLTEGNGGLSASIWKDSSRDSVSFLLAEIEAGVASDTIRNLLVKLLMTQAQPPQGYSGSDWLVLRLNTLASLGQDEKTLQMIAALPNGLATGQVMQLQAELDLARGDYDKACKHAQSDAHPAEDKSAVFWQKLNVLCLARSGKKDEAMIGLDVLRETTADDFFFQDEIRHITDKTVVIKSLPKKLSISDFAVIRAAGDTDKLKDRVDVLPALAVKYLAQDTAIDIKLREKATARAIQTGVIPPAEGNKAPEQGFAKNLASDVTTLVSALGSGNPPTDADNAVIARLALDDAGIQDSRRIEKLLTLMEIFDYKIQETVWKKLLVHKDRFDGEVPPAQWLNRLNQLSGSSRKGEIILLAALIADNEDPQKMSDLALVPITKALRLAGFDKEARELAYSAVKMYH